MNAIPSPNFPMFIADKHFLSILSISFPYFSLAIIKRQRQAQCGHYRCLHCDFEDKKKKKLEDHLMQVHKERDLALNKGMSFC
jgi:hypothetical protein